MTDELDNHPEDYLSLTYEDWCDILTTIEVKDERKIVAMHIKNIASAREASLSESNKSVSILRRKKAKTDVLRFNKSPRRANDTDHGVQCYCVLCKKAGMPERKYALHSSKDCTGVRTKRSIKDRMCETVGSRTDDVQQHKKYENKWKKYLKYLKKQKKYYIALTRNPAYAVKSRRSGSKLLTRLAHLPVRIGIMILH